MLHISPCIYTPCMFPSLDLLHPKLLSPPGLLNFLFWSTSFLCSTLNAGCFKLFLTQSFPFWTSSPFLICFNFFKRDRVKPYLWQTMVQSNKNSAATGCYLRTGLQDPSLLSSINPLIVAAGDLKSYFSVLAGTQKDSELTLMPHVCDKLRG